MSESIGRSLAAGNVAEVFEWGPRVIKLYRSAAAKPTVFREAANDAAVEALGLRRSAACNRPAVAGDRLRPGARAIAAERPDPPSFHSVMA